MKITMKPIGFVQTNTMDIPRHWSISDTGGTLVIDEAYLEGLKGITRGREIVVSFCFHKSPAFTPDLLHQTPPHLNETHGVFNICSPRRPNPIGVSVLKVIRIDHNIIRVKWLDMFDGTPILDIKPLMGCKTARAK